MSVGLNGGALLSIRVPTRDSKMNETAPARMAGAGKWSREIICTRMYPSPITGCGGKGNAGIPLEGGKPGGEPLLIVAGQGIEPGLHLGTMAIKRGMVLRVGFGEQLGEHQLSGHGRTPALRLWRAANSRARWRAMAVVACCKVR